MRAYIRVAVHMAFLAFAWLGFQSPARAAVDVHIDLSSQTMRVQSAKGGTYVWRISSARKGYVTPRGVYRAQSLARMHYSRKYDNAPMPHSIFFRGGYAIHGTNAVGSLGRPASHGCIRLAPGNAAALFAMVQREGGARITITGAPPRPVATASRRHSAEPLAYAGSSRPGSQRSLKGWLADPGRY